jgi:hypothetical protein
MMVKGEVKCLHCGYTGGSWTGEKGTPLTLAGFTAQNGVAPAGDPEAVVRCARCRGPVFLEGVEPVISSYRLRRIQRLRERLAEYERRERRRAA